MNKVQFTIHDSQCTIRQMGARLSSCIIHCALCIIFLLPYSFASAQVIPDSIRVDWSKAGLEGAVPQYSTIVDVTTFGAIPDDTINDYLAVANAISSLNNNSGVIYFPPGNYLIKSTINLTDSIIVRGAGSDSTTLTFNFNNTTANSFNIAKGQSGVFTPLISGYTKGSNKIVVTNASSLFSAGDQIEIREANGSWDAVPAPWATYNVGHLSKVDSTVGDTLWLREALRMNLDSALHPEIRKIVPRKMCGLECFKMIRTDGGATSVNYGVYFSFADNCWIRGVESAKSIGAHVAIEYSSHVYISGCYFHEAYLYDGASTNGYGVMLISHSCSNLIEDNIFRKLRHAMITKQGSNGNVFGYNYSIEPTRSELIPDFAADLCLHGHYAFSNLYEGNIGQNLQIDQTWGPSGPFNTFFRNKLELYGIMMSSGTVQSDRQNFVGNDVTNGLGQYILYGTNHFQHGNNIRGVITPTGTGSLLDTTYYLDTIPPTFWKISQPLPSIGTPNVPANDNNPARQRYLNGGVLTLCGFSPDTSVNTLINEGSSSFYGFNIENCVVKDASIVLILQSDKEYGQITIEIFSMEGKVLMNEKRNLKRGISTYSFNTNSKLPQGLYVIHISTAENNLSKKILVVE